MELALIVYLISFAVNLKSFFASSILVGFFAMIIFTIISTESSDDAPKHKKKWMGRTKLTFIYCCFAAVSMVFIPSEKTMYTMVGAYAVQKIAENPDVQKLQGKVLKIIEVKLDEYIMEAEKPSKN